MTYGQRAVVSNSSTPIDLGHRPALTGIDDLSSRSGDD
jgi:hypothetical protein